MTSARTWKDVVAEALSTLGGEAHLDQITALAIKDPKAVTNQRVSEKVRQVVRAFTVFAPVAGNPGVYRLTSPLPPVVAVTTNVPPVTQSSITDEVQGMLLSVGKMYGYGVYAPAEDRTKRRFQNQPLAQITDINTDLEDIVGTDKHAVVERIDVLWFDTDEIGIFPKVGFEVEHTTKIDTGLNRLAEIPNRFQTILYIIGDDEKDRKRFDNLLTRNVYKPFSHRVSFRTFADVQALYQAAAIHHQAHLENDQERIRFGVGMAGQ